MVSPEGRARTIAAFGEPLEPRQVVERICDDVAARGLDAVLDYGRRLDGVDLEPSQLRVSADELIDASSSGRSGLSRDDRRVRDNILAYQRAILHRERSRSNAAPASSWGCSIGRCGGWVSAFPAGRRLIRRALLMTVVPALAAGVAQIAVVVPPTRFGGFNADLLATCARLGVTEVYRIGGAQGVASLAYGLAAIGLRAGGQDRRAGQPLRRPGQAARLRHGRHRQHRRAERGRRDRRRDGPPAVSSPPTSSARPSIRRAPASS